MTNQDKLREVEAQIAKLRQKRAAVKDRVLWTQKRLDADLERAVGRHLLTAGGAEFVELLRRISPALPSRCQQRLGEILGDRAVPGQGDLSLS